MVNKIRFAKRSDCPLIPAHNAMQIYPETMRVRSIELRVIQVWNNAFSPSIFRVSYIAESSMQPLQNKCSIMLMVLKN